MNKGKQKITLIQKIHTKKEKNKKNRSPDPDKSTRSPVPSFAKGHRVREASPLRKGSKTSKNQNKG